MCRQAAVTRWVMALRERLQGCLLVSLLHPWHCVQTHVTRVAHPSTRLLKLPGKLLLPSASLLLLSRAKTTLKVSLSPVLCLAWA